MKALSTLVLALATAGLVFGATPVQAAKSAAHEVHWSYQGHTGPSYWGKLKSGNPTCAKGTRQSPINLYTSAVTHNAQPFSQQYHESKISLINNGHSVQADLAPKDNTLQYQGESYTLQQFHFHAPSEHTVDGISYPMELHLVHTNAAGKITVVGIFIKEGPENAALAAAFAHLPKNSKAVAYQETIDLTALLPQDHHAFTYSGSLTTPPCSEDVNWIVMQQPITLSPEQITAFKHLYPNNNRPLQALNGRKVNEE